MVNCGPDAGGVSPALLFWWRGPMNWLAGSGCGPITEEKYFWFPFCCSVLFIKVRVFIIFGEGAGASLGSARSGSCCSALISWFQVRTDVMVRL